MFHVRIPIELGGMVGIEPGAEYVMDGVVVVMGYACGVV